jgi:hypothetical protein
MFTLTPGTTAPELSVTRPVIVDVPICAKQITEAAKKAASSLMELSPLGK